MEKPFELSIVELLIANSLRKAVRVTSGLVIEAPHEAETIACDLLCKPRDASVAGYDGTAHVMAGFRLALRLCCRIFADPLRVHTAGVRRDVKDAEQCLDSWREERREVAPR